jgi:hypothetical protein
MVSPEPVTKMTVYGWAKDRKVRSAVEVCCRRAIEPQDRRVAALAEIAVDAG